MLFFDGGLGVVVTLLWLFCVVDVILTPEQLCRNLPKLAWVFIVLLFLDIGALAWLLAGRPWGARTWTGGRGSVAGSAGTPVADRSSGARPANPDDDEEFLASLRLRAEEQRRRARDAAEREGREPDKDAGL